MFKRVHFAAIGFFGLAQIGAAVAATVTVEADTASGKLVVEAKDATIDEVLTKLGKSQNFAIERNGEASSTRVGNYHLKGSASSILERLLVNESHMVITAAGGRTVQRVVMYGSRGGEPAAPAVAVKPAAQSPAANPAAKPVTEPVIAADPPIDPKVEEALERARKDAVTAKAEPANPLNQTSNPFHGHRSAALAFGAHGRGGF